MGIIVPILFLLYSCAAGLSAAKKNTVFQSIYGYGFEMVDQETVDDGYSPEGYPKYRHFHYFINRNTSEKTTLITYSGDTDKDDCSIIVCKRNYETWSDRFKHLKYVRVGYSPYHKWPGCD
ncbi:MAG: hypothetical protein LBE13_15305 [Bacteroidales bacterium]|nr:hypothetical protein [Bacteroidales bacterium]